MVRLCYASFRILKRIAVLSQSGRACFERGYMHGCKEQMFLPGQSYFVKR
jgi:hypothetical protein